jgi:hypothetical protein
MKLDSIVFNCPTFFGGVVHTNHQHQISAPSLENYLCTNDVFKANNNSDKHYNRAYLMTVEIDGSLFVLQKSRKLKRLLKISDKLSAYLDAIIVVVELTRDNDSNDLKLTTVYVAGDNASEDDNSDDSSDDKDDE